MEKLSREVSVIIALLALVSAWGSRLAFYPLPLTIEDVKGGGLFTIIVLLGVFCVFYITRKRY